MNRTNSVWNKCWRTLLLVAVVTVKTWGLVSATTFKVTVPEGCSWRFMDMQSDYVLVTCRNPASTNLSALPIENTAGLRLECDPLSNSASTSVTPGDRWLEHLNLLEEVTIEGCVIGLLPPTAFSGLSRLRNLTIHTAIPEAGEEESEMDWTSSSLQLAPALFDSLRHLEHLDLGYSAIWSLPKGTFCPLYNLNTLNLTHNKLEELTMLTFGVDEATGQVQATGQGGCQLDIEILDLSTNALTVLSTWTFSKLRRLRELYLQDNDIHQISEGALAGLPSLRILNLSGNRLTGLSIDMFRNSTELQELYVQNNSLSMLGPRVFGGLQQLLVLDLSYNSMTSDWLGTDTFQDLIRLVILNLSHNHLTRVDGSMFHSLYSLQILRLEHNQIDSIGDNAFASLYNLHTLVLSHNRLKQIDSFTLNGLYVLSLLSADNNQIDNIHSAAFRNCSNLQDLNLNGNSFFTVPESIHVLQFLKTLDLGENHISNLQNASFRGLQQLHGLRLIDNNVGNLTRGTFTDMPSLRILNLAKNKIQFIEPGSFDTTPNLQAIRLDSNYLSDMNGLFANLPNLIWLNISSNQISWFDYGLIPLSLQWLDIHANHITSLGNYFELESKVRLQTMDASFNRLTEISSSAVPDSIRLLFLNDNRITRVQPYTFFKKQNLTRVDLFGNKIQSMDLNALRLMPVSDERTLPEFYLGGNPFQCDCEMEWLQRINNLDLLRQHPTVMDLDSIYCKLLYNDRERTHIPLVEAQAADFLCAYKTHCFALCHCCDFDACDCEMTCPENCTCYHDQSWAANIVVCTKRNYTQMPDRIPMDATEVHLDGNNIKVLSSHSFIGRKNMKVLFLNNSYVQTINNRTFNGLRALQVLHLENNLLAELRGYEFERLENLRELYLFRNRLRFINNATFTPLRNLIILRIEGNYIVNFHVWNLNVLPSLRTLYLSHNPWSCECQFIEEFHMWLKTHSEKIIDYRDVVCIENRTRQIAVSTPVLEFSFSKCENTTATSIVQPLIIHDYLTVLVVTLSAFSVVFLVVLLVLIYRHEMRVWLYARHGLRMCYKHNQKDDEGKLFDAFISYSSKDENFVQQVLAPELEYGNPPYKLCLHYRDFPVGGYVSDMIVEAVESSKRTILVLSENFIKSEWCRFEFKSAHHQVLKDRRKRLIVILLGQVAQRDLDPDIRLYLKTNTYLRWGDKLFWEKLRFAMPDVKHRSIQRDNPSRSIAIHI